MVLLLVMSRLAKPRLHFFARCALPEADVGFEDVMPEVPFVASLSVGPSALSPAHRSLRIVTNETLAEEVAEYEMTWVLHPLGWEVPDRKRLTDHVVTGIEDAFVRPAKATAKGGKTRQASSAAHILVPDGDPLELGQQLADGSAGLVSGGPPTASGAVAAGLVDDASLWLDELNVEGELFFGLDQDAREVLAEELFGHDPAPLVDDSIPGDEGAAEEDDDASDASEGFADAEVLPPAGIEGDAPAAPAVEPDLADWVPPRPATLDCYPSATRPGQSYWCARIPRSGPEHEGTRSKTRNFLDGDPAGFAAARAFCIAWLQRWSAGGSGSGGGGSARGAGA